MAYKIEGSNPLLLWDKKIDHTGAHDQWRQVAHTRIEVTRHEVTITPTDNDRPETYRKVAVFALYEPDGQSKPNPTLKIPEIQPHKVHPSRVTLN